MGSGVKELGRHLFVFEDTCRVYIIKNNDRAVLIDFGSGEVLNCLSALGIREVTDILVTHHHRDQIQGLEKAYEQGIPIHVPHQEQDLIANADELWQRREIHNNYNCRQDRFSILNSVAVAGTLKDYSVHNFNGMEFEIIPAPGHTSGSISISTVIDNEKVCFTGDLIYGDGKLWSLAATQWTYNGGEGLPHHILSLFYLKEKKFDRLLPSHGEEIRPESMDTLIERLSRLIKLRRQNPRIFELRQKPYEKITEHVLFNRTSMSNSYVVLSESGKALFIDFGYDFMAGPAAGSDRSSRRPWLYTVPKLLSDFGVKSIDACIPTHYHDDHVAGLNLLREVYHTRILCPGNFADILSHPENYDLPCIWYDPIKVDEVIPVNQKYCWEEYEFTIHELSGHTRYSVLIEFTADRKKIACTGDQYADSDGLFCNYVYKNKFDSGDFIKSARLLKNIRPDIILTGHWPMLSYTEEYGEKLERLGMELDELHRALLPQDSVTDEFLTVIHPYQVSVKMNGSFMLKISVKNPLKSKAEIFVSLILPEGFKGKEYFAKEAEESETIQFCTEIFPPNEVIRRARIACDLTIDGIRFGQQAEMLVTVCQ